MKNLLILVTAIVFFSSCSIVKKSTSSKKEKVSIENKTSIDTSSSAFSKEDFAETEEVNNAVKEEAQYNNVVEIRFYDEDSSIEMQDFSDHTAQDYLPNPKTKIISNAPAKIKISKNGELEFSGNPSSIKIKSEGKNTKIDSSQSATKINTSKTNVLDKKGVSNSEVKAEAENTDNQSNKQKWRFNLIWLLWLLIIPVIRYSWQHRDKIKIWLFGH